MRCRLRRLAVADPEPESIAEPDAESGPDSDTESRPHPGPDGDSESFAQPDADPGSDAEPDTESVAFAFADTVAFPDADTGIVLGRPDRRVGRCRGGIDQYDHANRRSWNHWRQHGERHAERQ